MFAYNAGGVTDRSGELIAQGANNAAMLQMEAMGNFGQNIGNAIAQIGDAYSERKQLEAKASSYDDIGKILHTAMFSQNPDAAAAFGNLKKEKDPRKKVMGYEQLFSLVGPMSNMMMAQGRMEQAPELQDQRTNDQRDIMYERERLKRESEMMNTPQAPAPVAVPTAMRRFNKPI